MLTFPLLQKTRSKRNTLNEKTKHPQVCHYRGTCGLIAIYVRCLCAWEQTNQTYICKTVHHIRLSAMWNNIEDHLACGTLHKDYPQDGKNTETICYVAQYIKNIGKMAQHKSISSMWHRTQRLSAVFHNTQRLYLAQCFPVFSSEPPNTTTKTKLLPSGYLPFHVSPVTSSIQHYNDLRHAYCLKMSNKQTKHVTSFFASENVEFSTHDYTDG